MMRDHKSPGSASSSEQETFTVNALGEKISYEDRKGSVHEYTYDLLGRLTSDDAGNGSGTRKSTYTFDTAGLPEKFTGYDSFGSVWDQVLRQYNGFGQLTTEFQEHTGAVNTSTTPKVQYAYSLLSGGANHSRLTSMTYPDGRILRYEYASGIDDTISRLSYLADDLGGSVGTHLEELSYLGLGTIIQRAHPESGVDLTYIGTTPGDGGDPYTGMDRFGNIIDQNWTDGTTDADRYQYGYDRDSNRLFKKNTVNTSLSELYHANGAANGYDSLNRLTDFGRGALSDSNSDGVMDTIATPSRTQGWTLDALGNWSSSSTDGTSTSRTHDKQNEITQVGSNTLTYDDNGNLTTDEQGHTLMYDAWNRITVIQGPTTLVLYSYDALGRRISETHQSDTTELYYSSQWQVLQEDAGNGVRTQNIWSAAYVDALVLRDVNSGSAGALDGGFGTNGKAATAIDNNGKQAHFVLQVDGKFVVAGGGSNDFILARYNADGSLDNSFGTNGMTTLDFSGYSDWITGLAIQADGKIVAGGVASNSTGEDFALARFNPDGTLDSSFGSSGQVIISAMENINTVAIQSDGKIVMGGYKPGKLVLARCNSDGSLDSSFGTSGIATYSSSGLSSSMASGAVIQPDGKIVVAGTEWVMTGPGVYTYYGLLLRFNPDGTLDSGFGTAGVFITSLVKQLSAVAIQPDGRIVVEGTDPTTGKTALLRLNAGVQRLYITQDANYNVTALVGTDGAVKQRHLYDSYGSQTVLSPTWGSTTDAYGLLVGFQGGWRDPATGLYLFNIGGEGREYRPTLGRWLQQDRGGYVDGANLYPFVRNNPANYLDPMGLASIDSINILKNDGSMDVQITLEKEACQAKLEANDKVIWSSNTKLPPGSLTIHANANALLEAASFNNQLKLTTDKENSTTTYSVTTGSTVYLTSGRIHAAA